jgi:ATP-dependent exoDNAse (exonuclease V) beta subunit
MERAAVSRAPLSATGVKAPEFEPSFASPRISAGRHSGPILGTAFHRLLYRIDLGDLQSQAAPSENWRAARKEAPEYLEKLVLQTALESGLETADDLSELLRQPLPQLLADAFAGARAVIREVPFLIELNGEGSGLGPALYEGIIDVVVEQADGTLLILDYKTDSVSADEVEGRMEAYRAQGSIYRAAAEKGSDRSVSDVLFYFVRPGVVYSQKVQGILA